MHKHTARRCILAGVVMFLMGCNSDSADTLNDLKTNRAKWENLNVTDYQLISQLSCFCSTEITEPKTVIVEGNEITTAASAVSNRPFPTDSDGIYTISQLFDRIELEAGRAETLIVDYDSQFGFPTLISIDVDQHVADDEMTITVKNMQFAEDIICTEALQDGLLVTINDASDGTPAACGAIVTAMDEDGYTETRNNNDAACDDETVTGLLTERPGVYDLTITKAGYQTQEINGFAITEDFCHVLPRALTVALVPAGE